MLRLTMALVLTLSFLPPALASLTPRAERSQLGRQPPSGLLKEKAPPEKDDGLVITEKTEVKVDGKSCQYEQVPDGADIVLLEVAADKKMILRIHFRSKK
jgi:hypothetical protein